MSILKANRIENLTTTDGGININNSGQVAIGVASASKPLHIYQTADAGIRIQNSTTGTGTTDGILLEATGSDGLFWNYESGNLRFATGNSERLRIDSIGRVGIGTSSPAFGVGSGLEIERAGSATLRIEDSASSSGFEIQNASGSIDFNGYNSQPFTFKHNTTERLRIDSSGRLLINTTNGVELIHGVGGGLRLTRNTTGNPSSGQSLMSVGFHGVNDTNTNAAAEAKIEAFAAENHSGTTAATNLRFYTKPSGTGPGSAPLERMRIAANGDVGIGVAPAAQKLQVHESASSTESYVHITNAVSGSTSADGMLLGMSTSAEGIVWNAENTALLFATNNTERMRVNNSGMLQVGGTTSADNGNKVEITSSSGGTIGFLRNDTSTVQGDPIGAIGFYGNDSNGTYQDAARIEVNADGDHATGDKPAKIEFKVSADGGNTPIQRFIIESDGEQRMFSANPSYTLVLNNGASAGTSYLFLEGRHSATSNTGQTGTRSLSITTNGNIYNTNNSYGQISDVKLKENIVNASSQWDDIKGVQVRNFNFKEETGHPTHTQIGVVAQELETVSPGLVYDTPDVDADRNDLGTVTKTVNYSVLYMKAVKALQEAQTRIETLETQNTAQQTQIDDLLSRVTALETAS